MPSLVEVTYTTGDKTYINPFRIVLAKASYGDEIKSHITLDTSHERRIYSSFRRWSCVSAHTTNSLHVQLYMTRPRGHS
jgi:hypothetical protein